VRGGADSYGYSVCIAANPKGSAGGGQPRAYMPSGCLRPQLSSPS
jgi:hypothetical protein